MLRKNRWGVCNIKPIQSKLHPTQGLFDAIPKLVVAVQPSDWGRSVLLDTQVTVHGMVLLANVCYH